MPSMAVCAPGSSAARYSSRASARYRISLTSVDLPEPLTPVTVVEHAERNADVDVLEVVLARALDDDRGRASAGRRARGVWIAPLAAQVGRRSATRCRRPAAAAACPGRSRGRRARRPRARDRRRSRPSGSSLRRARRRARCCRDRAAAPASRGARGCRADAGRSTARRARRARRSGSTRSAWPAGCAALRRPTASRRCGRASGSRRRRR